MNVSTAQEGAFDPDAEIGARVHQAMFRARMSQTRMAPLIGVNQSVLSRKLRGAVTWSAVDVLRASLALGVALEELLPDASLCAASIPDQRVNSDWRTSVPRQRTLTLVPDIRRRRIVRIPDRRTRRPVDPVRLVPVATVLRAS